VGYGLATVGSFAVIGCLRDRGEEADTFDDLSGLAEKYPWLAWIMLLSVFSLLGMPPFVGFVGKVYLFGAAFDAGQLFFSLGINDGKRVQCQCERCVEVGWPHAYYDFVKAVADAVKDRYPPQMVGVLAYGDVGLPPRDLPPEELVPLRSTRPRPLTPDGGRFMDDSEIIPLIPGKRG